MKQCLCCQGFYPDDFEKCDTCGYGTLINYENYKKLQTLPFRKREKLYPEEMRILREYDPEQHRKPSPKSQVTINPSAMPIKKEEPKQDVLKCPKCGSTQVAIGQRGWTLMTGFLGSNKTMNRCGNCGHKWYPKE